MGTQDQTPKRRRRSPRLLWRDAVAAVWTNPGGESTEVAGECEVVSAHGGLIRLPLQAVPAGNLQLMHMRTREWQAARVVWQEPVAGQSALRLGVELAHPSENFWGVHTPMGFGPGVRV